MKYTSSLGILEYEFYTSFDKAPVDLDLIFKVGGADKVLYIASIETEDRKLQSVTQILSEFCNSFTDGCLVYSVDSRASGMNAMMRYVLQQVGFISTARFIDDKDCTLFLFRNVTASSVIQNLEDEFFSFVLDEMLRDESPDRIRLLFDRLGASSMGKLKTEVDAFCDSVSASPIKMEL